MNGNKNSIDWANHLIAFFSALFGILIAFGLEQWREERDQQELVRTAFENLRKEIQLNQNTLHESVKNNQEQLTTLSRLSDHLDDQLMFAGSRAVADSINKNFSTLVFIDTKSSTGHQHKYPMFISMGNLTIPSMQTSAMESAKATGALTWMNYEKVLSLSLVYNDVRITDELGEIKRLWRQSEDVQTKSDLTRLMADLLQAHRNLEAELEQFDTFVNMLNAME